MADNSLAPSDIPAQLAQRYSFLIVGWDAADLPPIRARIANEAPLAAITENVITKPPDPQAELHRRHPVFVALESAVSAHAARAREAGLLPVVVLSRWTATLAGLNDSVFADELAPALAILATPEVLWLFGSDTKVTDAPWPRYHSLDQIRTGLWDPSFDWTGLRWWARNQLLLIKHPDDYSQKHRVAALDDEPRYALFEAYCGYRFGYPALAPASMDEAAKLLHPDNATEFTTYLHWFEDIYVRLHDDERDISDPEKRNLVLPAVGKALSRTIVSSGGDEKGWDEHWRALEDGSNGKIRLIFKPIKGLLDLWDVSPVSSRGTAALIAASDPAGSHAAPGAITLTASKMLARAEALSRQDASFSNLLLAAILCVDVERLLCGRSPTTALEALSIKHQAEVRLECVFHGVAAAPDIQKRLDELKKSIGEICGSYEESARDDAQLAAGLEIQNQLIAILRQYGRFEEEQVVLRHARELRRGILQQSTNWWKKFEAWLLRYPNFILSSPFSFLAGLWLGIVFFSWAYVPFVPDASGSDLLWRSSVTTLSIQPLNNDASGRPIDLLCMTWGLTHFGVFLSHLYSLISRR